MSVPLILYLIISFDLNESIFACSQCNPEEPIRYDPRAKFHGDGGCRLAQTIVDINKAYCSIFEAKGIVDGVLTASIGKTVEEAIRPETAKKKGLLLRSWDCVALDAIVATLEGKDLAKIGYLKLAPSLFGGSGMRSRSKMRGAVGPGSSVFDRQLSTYLT